MAILKSYFVFSNSSTDVGTLWKELSLVNSSTRKLVSWLYTQKVATWGQEVWPPSQRLEAACLMRRHEGDSWHTGALSSWSVEHIFFQWGAPESNVWSKPHLMKRTGQIWTQASSKGHYTACRQTKHQTMFLWMYKILTAAAFDDPLFVVFCFEMKSCSFNLWGALLSAATFILARYAWDICRRYLVIKTH